MSPIPKLVLFLSFLITPSLAEDNYLSVGVGSSTFEVDGWAYVDGLGNDIALYSLSSASLSGPQVSYSGGLTDNYNYGLSYSTMEGDGVQRDEISISLMRSFTPSLSGAVGIYQSNTDISSAILLHSSDVAIDNSSLFVALQTGFPLGQNASGFARLSYQMGNADVSSAGYKSETEPSGTAFSFGGVMPLGVNRFFELTYDIKDIEYVPAQGSGGDPEEDFTTLRASLGMTF